MYIYIHIPPPHNIGLAKKLVWVYPLDGAGKSKQTFLGNPIVTVLTLPNYNVMKRTKLRLLIPSSYFRVKHALDKRAYYTFQTLSDKEKISNIKRKVN